MDINDLRRKRKAAADSMGAAATALAEFEAADTPQASDIEAAQAQFDTAKAEFDRLNAAVARAEAVEQAQAVAAVSEDVTPTPAPAASVPSAPAMAQDPAMRGVEVGFMVQALAATKSNLTASVAMLENNGHSGIAAVLSGATATAGGVTVPQPLSAEIIKLLKARTVVRASGARSVPMPAGNIRDARQTGRAVAGYGGTVSPAVESSQTFEPVDKSFKTLTALVPIANDLLNMAGPDIAMFVRDDLIDSMALKEDLAFLRYDGSGDLPKGLLHWALAGHTQNAVAATAAAAETAIRRAVSVVEDSNVMMQSCGWAMRASAKNWLAGLRDAAGHLVFPSIDSDGTLKGFPIRTTSQIPDNLGGGAETEIYFADFNEIVIGDTQQITIASSSEAAYVDQSGDTHSAFQERKTLMRAVSQHDIAPNHDEAIAVINGNGWSA